MNSELNAKANLADNTGDEQQQKRSHTKLPC